MDEHTVLVVEDEAAIAEAVRARLASEGYRVLVTGDGPSALDAAGREHPDLVVLDLMLPGMDGLEVCRELQKDTWVPVLMLTARTDESDKVAGFAVGADDYLTKPFSLRELAVRVKAILRRMDRIRSSSNGSAASSARTARSRGPSRRCMGWGTRSARTRREPARPSSHHPRQARLDHRVRRRGDGVARVRGSGHHPEPAFPPRDVVATPAGRG